MNQSSLTPWQADVSVPHYVRCPQCQSIVPDEHHELSELSKPCLNCAFTGRGRVTWPRGGALFLMGWVNDQDLSDTKSRLIATVLLSTTLEVLLEESLHELLKVKGTPYPEAKKQIGKANGRGRMVKLYNKHSDKNLYDLMNELNRTGFWQDWICLVELRHMIVHQGQIGEMPPQCQHLVKQPIEDLESPAKEQCQLITRVWEACLPVFVGVDEDIRRQRGKP